MNTYQRDEELKSNAQASILKSVVGLVAFISNECYLFFCKVPVFQLQPGIFELCDLIYFLVLS